jgi:hypothetical protein
MAVFWEQEHGFARRFLLTTETSQSSRLLELPFAVHCAFEQDGIHMHLRLQLVGIGTILFYVLALRAER